MATDGPTPPACKKEIFENGQPILVIDGASNAVENWVRQVARKADAQIDWHYSGGVAQVLHLGDSDSWNKTVEAITALAGQLKGRILKQYEQNESGLFRNGVTPTPEGAVAGFYVDGKTQFM